MTEPGETAVYLERFNNYGITRQELQSDRPIIGIAQTGNDLTPCNRHHLQLAAPCERWYSRRRRNPFRVPGPPVARELSPAYGRAGSQPCLSGPGRGSLRISARWRRADDRLRQDHAGLPDGRGDRRICRPSSFPGDRWWIATIKASSSGSGMALWEARRMLAADEINDGELIDPGLRLDTESRALQHNGHGALDEFARRSAGDVPAWLRRDPGALWRAGEDGLSHGSSHCGHGGGRPHA